MINSSRKYRILMHDSDGISSRQIVDIQELIKKDAKYELIYAMQDIGDKVLDLKVNESIYFRPNRDQTNSKGIIIRVK